MIHPIKSNLAHLILPPLIGSILLLGLAIIWEVSEDTSGIEPCETYTLSFIQYLTLFLGSLLVGTAVQLIVIEQILGFINIYNASQWIVTGFILSLLLGTGITFLFAPTSLSFYSSLHAFSSAYLLAAVYVFGALLTSRRIKLRAVIPVIKR